MLRGFFVGCPQKHLSVPIYFLMCAETFHVARIYLLSAQRNIRCADLFYKCPETFVIVCEGEKPASRDYIIDPTRHEATSAGYAANCLACAHAPAGGASVYVKCSSLISLASVCERYSTFNLTHLLNVIMQLFMHSSR